MTYSVKLSENNEYKVNFNPQQSQVVNSNLDDTNSINVSYYPSQTYDVKSDLKVTLMAQTMSDLADVVTTNLNSSTNNYVLTYDSVNNKYVFVDPDVVLLAAANLPTNQVTSSGLPTAFANNIIDSAIEPIDGGNF